jgi:hypothetical protein
MARMYRGVVAYRDPDGSITGRETFVVSVHADGTRTLRCLCEMDNIKLVRDVTYTVNAKFEAMDCFVRVIAEDKFVGSGWAHFTDTHAEIQSFTAAENRVTQRIETPGRVKLYGTHPICIDIWKCAHIPAERPGELQPLTNCFGSTLVRETGAGGPMLYPKTYDITYVGPQTVTVAAGTFECQNYQWDTGNGRTLDMYTTPGDFLPIRVSVPQRQRNYDLVEFEDLKSAADVIL